MKKNMAKPKDERFSHIERESICGLVKKGPYEIILSDAWSVGVMTAYIPKQASSPTH